MKYVKLITLWPSHNLEDFPQHLGGRDADSLLASWTALWHPTLLASAQQLPTWHPADQTLPNLKNQLVVVPTASESLGDANLVEHAERQGTVVIAGKSNRDEIVEAALSPMEKLHPSLDLDLAADFLALGYCYLQIERLTHQMHYSSTLDGNHFRDNVLKAANAAVSADFEAAREQLATCFDALAQERDHYYPIDAFVIDLLVIAPTTMGQPFVKELSCDTPLNVLMSAETVNHMAGTAPASLVALREALDDGRAALIGGEYTEQNLSLLSPETILRECKLGLESYEKRLSHRPAVFGRRRFGLTPVLPQILKKLAFTGVLHATLDDGHFPEGPHAKSDWIGVDGSAIEAFARAPLDAARPETFLNYASHLGDSMDVDHVATVCLAHWPGQASMWREDLRRIARYVPVLGKFVTLPIYFQNAEHVGHGERFEMDRYRCPYLRQAVKQGRPNPISVWVNYNRCSAGQGAVQAYNVFEALLTNRDKISEPSWSAVNPPDASKAADNERLIYSAAPQNTAIAGIAQALPRADTTSEPGFFFCNAYSFPRRCHFELAAEDGLPPHEPPVHCTGFDQNRAQLIVDLPAMGFAWVPCPTRKSQTRRPSRPLADSNVLCNEFMEAQINPSTGTLKSLHDFEHRGNRLSQQLAFRLSRPSAKSTGQLSQSVCSSDYSVMVADRVDVTCSTSALGEITCEGHLATRAGKKLAHFRQIYQLWRGSRVLLLHIELDPVEFPGSEPWNSYFASRFAWNDPTATLFRDVAWGRQATELHRFEAPLYVDIDMPDARTAILTGGIPYHQRIGDCVLDTLLIVRGESARNFQLGIGIDLSNSLSEALNLIAPPTVLRENASRPAPSTTGWFFHVDAKNIMTTHLEPLYEGSRAVGFRTRLLETQGKHVSAMLRCCRALVHAKKLNFLGKKIVDCTIEGGGIRIEMTSHEWTEFEVRWEVSRE